MQYDLDEIIDRRETYSIKWDYPDFLKQFGITERYDRDTIPLYTADMDFRCAKPIQEAIRKVAEHNIYGYTMALAQGYGNTYFDAITGWFDRHYQWKIKGSEIFYAAGTLEGIKTALRAVTTPGDQVVINRPIYTPFNSTIEAAGDVVVNSPLHEEGTGHYVLDYDDFEKKISDPKTKAFLLCNPHNPTGRIWTDEELLKMADICRRNKVVIIADEIHGDLIRKESTFHPIATIAGPEGIITCTALNKTFNLAGLQAANIVIQDEELRTKYAGAGFVCPNPFTMAATVAAYNEGQEWLDQVNEYLDANIDFVLDFLKKRMPMVRAYRPEGTYIMWLDFNGYGLSDAEIHKKIYVDANVLLEDGKGFDPENGIGFQRVCLPTPRAKVAEAFERIAKEFENC